MMSDKIFQLFMVVAILATIANADNFTHRYMTMGAPNEYQTRQGRIFSFTTDDNGEISIEIQFSVPFIRIPVDKALNFGKGAVAKFNIASLAIGGVMVLAAGLIFPSILSGFNQKLQNNAYYSKNGRDRKLDSFEWWRILAVMDQALTDNNVDTTSCMQKAVCWTVQSSRNKIKFVDSILASDWINQYIEGTPLQSAIQSGMNGANCAEDYKSCQLSQTTFLNFIQQFTKAINLS